MMMSEMKRSIPSRIILGNYEKTNSKKAYTTTDKKNAVNSASSKRLQINKEYVENGQTIFIEL